MGKYLITSLVCLLGIFDSYSQVTPQNGSASFSLPVFNWQDHKSRLKAFVALSYQSGNGLKVNEMASSAGQGWTLLQGGVISRIQVGLPDDQKAFVSTNPESIKDFRKYPNGRLWASQNLKYHPQVTRYPLFTGQNEKYANFNAISEDKQLDYFAFQFNGKSGMFVIDPSNNEAFTLEYSRLKITFQHDQNLVSQGIRTTITSFTIQDEDGLIYRFSNKSLTKVLKQKYTDRNLVSMRDQPRFKNANVYFQSFFDVGPSSAPWSNSQMANPFVVNNWHLTEIQDPLTGRKVMFNYTLQNLNSLAGYQVNNFKGDKDYVVVTQNRSVTVNQIISGIVFPDGHSVNFNYGDNRIDLPGDNVLSSIDVLYNGRYLSRHALRQSYMSHNRYASSRYLSSAVAFNGMARRVARLCLRSVTKYGPDLKEDESPYQFDYYLGSSGDDVVPGPFTLCADNWGYYNGNNSRGFSNETIPLGNGQLTYSFNQYVGLTFQRAGVSGSVLVPKSNYARNGLLRQVVYPTGGTLTYEYEQNRANLSGEKEVGGVRVSRISTTDGGGSNDCSNPINTSYKYVMADNVSSSMWGIEMPVHITGSSSNYKPETRIYKWTLNGPIFGQCDFKFKFPGLLNVDQGISTSDVAKFLNVLSYASGVYGIISNISTLVKIVTVGGSATGLVIDAIIGVISLGVSCIVTPNRNYSNAVYTNGDLNQVAPLPGLFRRVEIVKGSGTMGKVVQEFSDNSIIGGYLDIGLNENFTQKQRYTPWAFGLPTKTIVYDAAGKTVSETINEYNVNTTLRGCAGVKCSLKPMSSNSRLLWSRSQRVDRWTSEGLANDPQVYLEQSNSDLIIEYYGYRQGRSVLTKTTQRTFRPDGINSITEQTTYSYDYDTYDLTSVESVKSNGDIMRKTIRYNTEFPSGVLQTMTYNNILSIPVAVRTWGIANGQTVTYDETVNEFISTIGGDIKPWRVLKQRFNQPSTSIAEYQGPGSSISQYKITSEYIYDGAANLVGVRDEGGRTVTNVYDNDGKFVTASVVNALPSDNSLYTSFETSELGGWTLTGTAIYETSITPKSGFRLFTLSSSNANSLTSQNLNTAKSYVVSFWANRNGVVVSGGTLTKSGPTFNSLTYYEYNISAGASSTTISKPSAGVPALIDELRLYPATSRMRTVSYDPVIGKVTDCDENSRSTYYEYDNLGRMSLVRDEARNIIKAYDYNTVNPIYLTGCPKTYFNKAISEGIMKNNCGSGFLATEVVFSVPANKYSSTISQEDADMKAEAELLRDGQAFANANGVCQPIYYNTLQSSQFTTQNCNPGFVGGTVTYFVPPGRYSSLISQADANDQAIEEIDDNGQAFANGDGAVCIYSTAPLWEWLEVNADSTYCQSVNGQLPPNLFILETDINPNSATFNQKRWSNVGPNDACPSNRYYNVARSQVFTRNNCPNGTSGGTWTYSVRPGKYFSTISQADADQQAINEVNSNGQAAANQNATCITLFNLTSNNIRSFQYSIRFTNNATGIQYSFTAMANNTNFALGQVPSGTYTVYICPINNYANNNNYQIGTTFVTGVVCTWFYNVNVSGSLQVRIY